MPKSGFENSVGLQVTGLESQVPWAGPLSRPGNWVHLSGFQTGQLVVNWEVLISLKSENQVKSSKVLNDAIFFRQLRLPEGTTTFVISTVPCLPPTLFFREIMKLLLDESSFFLGSVPVKSSKSCQLQFFLAKSCWIPIFWLELPWNAPRLKRQLAVPGRREASRVSPGRVTSGAIENGHRNSGFTHEKWWIFP